MASRARPAENTADPEFRITNRNPLRLSLFEQPVYTSPPWIFQADLFESTPKTRFRIMERPFGLGILKLSVVDPRLEM